jgi:hypothetical protein
MQLPLGNFATNSVGGVVSPVLQQASASPAGFSAVGFSSAA